LPFSLGVLGGGDVKLLAACACVFGLSELLPLAVYTALIGGVIALFVMLWRRVAKIEERIRLPYAVPIALAVAWLALAESAFPQLKIL